MLFSCFMTTNTAKRQLHEGVSEGLQYFHVGCSAMQWRSLWSQAGVLVATALVLQPATARLCPLPGGCASSSWCPSTAGLIPWLGKTSIVVMDVVSYQEHSCCGPLALSFNPLKFHWILAHASWCLHLCCISIFCVTATSNPLPNPSLFSFT